MPVERTNIRIFVSSPGDVSSERFVAEKVIQRLQEEFSKTCQLEPIFWEHEPLTAAASFQEELVSPAATDIVVCILWSRLGTRLPKKVTGDRKLTGTEYEFEEALRARNERGYPHLLVYRKTARPIADLSDRQRRREAIDQIEALEAFIDRWFHDESGALVAAFHPFDDAATFEEHLAHHLRKLVERRLHELGIDFNTTTTLAATWVGASPFRGLAAFEPEHAPIYFGRTKAVGESIDYLRRMAAAQRGFLLILGASGCGKSSMVRAGMIPLLTQPNVIEGVRAFRYLVVRPSTAQGDLFDMLAAALSEALPELLKDGTSLKELSECMRSKPQVLVALIKGALALVASQYTDSSASALPRIGLLIVVDQLEELFTLFADQPQVVSQLAELIHELVCNPMSRTLVVATLRSDFYHNLLAQPRFAALQEESAPYILQPPTVSEISQIIRLPAQAAGLQFEEDASGTRLDDALRDEAARDPSVLPLLEFTLDELYRMTGSARVLTFANYETLGGVAGALAKRAEAVFVAQPSEVQAAFSSVFRELVTFSHSADNVATACVAPVDRIRRSSSQSQLVDALVNARLLVSDSDSDGKAIVRVAHESLLLRWTRLADWLKQNQRLLKNRDRLATAAARWHAEGRPKDLLLPAGKQLQEAEELLATDVALSTEATQFVFASKQSVRRQQLGWKALQAAVFFVILIGSAISIKFGFDAQEQSAIAQTKSQQAVATSEKLDLANQSLNRSLSRALRGPIGAGDMGMMNDAETDALRELAALRQSVDVSQFLSDFMETNDTTTRMLKRGPFVFQTALAGDRNLRQKFEQLMLNKLKDEQLSKDHRWKLASVWHSSECKNAEIDVLAAPLLLQQITEPSFVEIESVKAFVDVVGRLPTDQGQPLLEQAARTIFDRMNQQKIRLSGLHFEVNGYVMLVDRLPVELVEQWNNQLTEKFIQSIESSTEWFDKMSMSKWVVPFAVKMPGRSDGLIKVACDSLVEELDNGKESVKHSQIAAELGAILKLRSQEEATGIGDMVAQRLIKEIREATDPVAARSSSGGLTYLGQHLSAEVLRTDLFDMAIKSKNVAVVAYAAQTLSRAIPNLSEEDAREISQQFAPMLVSVFERAQLGYWSRGLAEGIKATMPLLEDSQREELTTRISDRLKQLTPRDSTIEKFDQGGWAATITNLVTWIDADSQQTLADSVNEILQTPVKYRNPIRDTSLGMALNQASDMAECRLKLAQALASPDIDKWRKHLLLQQLEVVPSLVLNTTTMPDYPVTSMNNLQESVQEVQRRMTYALMGFENPLPPKFLRELLDHPFCVSIARDAVLKALNEAEGRKFKDRWDVPT